MSENKQEKRSSHIYRFMHGVATFLTHTITPLTAHDLHNIPEKAPFIIICNHKTFYDPVAIIAAVKNHEISFLSKKEIMKVKLLKWFFTKMHCIPVDRGHTDMAAMRACVKTLREGGVLGIFPEGTRHREGVMEHLEGGASLLTLRSRVPLVPVYITPKFRFFRRMHLYVDKPIAYDDLLEQGVNNETCAALNARITATYAALVKKHG